MNFTLDDSSPRIKYFSTSTDPARGWQRAINTGGGDPGQMKYFKQTFALTVGEGDRMVLAFNGSACWIFGSNWFNHGGFSASIDDRKPTILSGSTAERIFQTLLYSVTDLDPAREHIVTLTNLPSVFKAQPAGTDIYLDIDYIVIHQPISKPIFTTEFDNLSPKIRYGGSWTGLAQNASSTTSNAPGDTSTLTFNGTSIEVLGSLAPDRGNFTASIDGVNKGMYSGYWVEPLPDTSLFSVSGLSESEHTLVLTNLGGNRGNIFDLNRIIVNSTIDPLSYSSIGSSPQTKSQSAGGLIGGIVGGIAALAIIAGGVFWWLRRRKGAQRTDTTLIDLTGEEVKPYPRNESPNEGSPMTEYVLSSDGNSSVGDRYYSTPAYTILSIPQPPGSNVSSCPRSTVAGSIMGTDPPTPLAQGRYASQLSISQTSHSQGPFNDQISAIDPFHNRSDSLLSSNPTPAITTQLPYRLPSPNRSPITPPPGENTSSTLSRPSFVSDQKSSAAASIIHELRYQDSPINDDAARTRRADEDEARLRLVRRAEEDEARDRMERRRAEEEEVMTMPPPYA